MYPLGWSYECTGSSLSLTSGSCWCIRGMGHAWLGAGRCNQRPRAGLLVSTWPSAMWWRWSLGAFSSALLLLVCSVTQQPQAEICYDVLPRQTTTISKSPRREWEKVDWWGWMHLQNKVCKYLNIWNKKISKQKQNKHTITATDCVSFHCGQCCLDKDYWFPYSVCK